MSTRKPPAKIKAVLFDLGRVILDFNFDPAYKLLSRKSSTALCPEDIRRYFMTSGIEVLFDSGKISSANFYRKIKKDLSLKISRSAFNAAWNKIFKQHLPMIRLIKKLKNNYRLVLISNTNEMHFKYIIKKYAIFRLFDSLIVSYQEKIRKPDERIYRIAQAKCKAKPQEILYIDDRLDFTEAARDLHFNVFTFKNNPKTLIKYMLSLGIKEAV